MFGQVIGVFPESFYHMAKGCSTVLLIFLLVITLPVWIGIAGGLIGVVAGIAGTMLGVVLGIFGAIGGIIGSLFGAIGKIVGLTFGGAFHPIISIKPFFILVIILVVLISLSRNKTVK